MKPKLAKKLLEMVKNDFEILITKGEEANNFDVMLSYKRKKATKAGLEFKDGIHKFSNEDLDDLVTYALEEMEKEFKE